MTLKQLQNFIEKEHKRLIERYGILEDAQKRTLARTVKLMEEVGELCNEILSFNIMHRKEKMRKKNKEKLGGFLAAALRRQGFDGQAGGEICSL